jgi:chromosomal replication initiator protein
MKEANERLKENWETVLARIGKIMSKGAFEGLLQNARLREVVDGEVRIEVMNEFVKDRIISNYREPIEKVIQEILEDSSVKVKLVSAEEGATMSGEEEKDEPAIVIHDGKAKTDKARTEEDFGKPRTSLNEKYTFAAFVIGKTNELAYSYSKAVAESPGEKYNPLFVYGGVGVGKTHLMQAIGHHVIEKNPRKKTIYVSSEQFLNDLLFSLAEKKEREFRAKYRTTDVLIVDDIQFIAGKERTQEEFFHTFNELFQRNKQVVLSSDRKPHEILNLESRLVSRFESGLVADIQPPDLELRMAILKKLSIDSKINIPTEVISYMAEKISSNIRQLVGAFINVMAFASVHKSRITNELADEVLKEMSSRRKRKITVEEIQETVGAYYNLKIADLKSPRRNQALAFPRQIAMFLSRELTEETTTSIGEKFGGRDHTTVIHAENKIRVDSEKKDEVREVLRELTRRMENA